MRVGLLGPLEVSSGGAPVRIRSAPQRLMLALLALRPGRAVTSDELIDAIWHEELPAKPATALQIQVSRLRKSLPDGVITTSVSGYVLEVPPADVDIGELEALRDEGRALAEVGDVAGAINRHRRADALWRGEPFVDVPDCQRLTAAASVLREQRLEMLEQLCEWELQTDAELGDLLGRLEQLVDAHPLREPFTGLLMRALYRAGRQSDALQRYGELRRHLRDELGVHPSPQLAAIELAILTHDDALAPAVPAGDPQSVRPPAALTSFVGRAEESQRALEALDRHRLVTIVGPGGGGKTRLVTELFDELAVRGHDGAWFVPLSEVDLPEAVAAAVGTALGIEGGGRLDQAELIVRRLSRRSAVIVLDNCEHVLEAAAGLVVRILADCPEVRIVVTSREPLLLQGERVELLDGLAVGDDRLGDAERLFVDRTRNRGLVDPDPILVSRLCRLVEGWPLAIELIAANVGDLGPDADVDAVESAITALQTPYRDVSDRHASLSDTLDWSYRLLDEELGRAYCALGVFDGPITPDAVAAVLGKTDFHDPWDLVRRLAQRSLVVLDADGHSASMLRPVVQHARAVATSIDASRAAAVESAFIEHFDRFTADVDKELDGPESAGQLQRFRQEEPNVLRAIEVAVNRERWDVAATTASQAGFGWLLGSRQLVALGVMERLVERADGRLPWTARRDLGQAMGYLNGSIGRFDRAQAELTAVLELQVQHDDVRRVTTLGNLAGILEQTLRLGEALEHLDAAFTLLPAFAVEAGEERATSSRSSLATKRASVLTGLGRYGEAVAAAADALTAAEHLGGYWCLTALGGAIEALIAEGDIDGAQDRLRELERLDPLGVDLDEFRAQLVARNRAAVALLEADAETALDRSSTALSHVHDHEAYELGSCLRIRIQSQLLGDDRPGALSSLRRCLDVVIDGGGGELVPVLLTQAAAALGATDSDSAALLQRVGEVLRTQSGFALPAWADVPVIEAEAVPVDPTLSPIEAARLCRAVLVANEA